MRTEGQTHLERCSLSQAGIDAAGVKTFLDEIESGGYHLHTFMLVRDGKVAYECNWAPYELEEEHLMHSFTKGLVATAIGILEGEGRISLNDSLISYFPEYEVDHQNGWLDEITLWTLLTMTSGHAFVPDRHGCDDEVKTFLTQPIVNRPGTVFLYDSMGTSMLSAVVKRVTGYNLFQFLEFRVFRYLGISGVSCDTCTSGKDQGGGGSHLKTEDMAKIAQLYLNKGCWNGKQLIPEDWVERMTKVQFADSKDGSNPDWEDWKCGYGFQVWMCQVPNTFRFDGMYGQFGVVFKDLDAAVITTCGECVTEEILRLIWKDLFPAIKADLKADERDGTNKTTGEGKSGLSENQQELMKELEERKKTLHISWEMEDQVSAERAEALWNVLLDRDLIFPENRESVLSKGRVKNFFTSTWTEMQRNGIQKLRFERENGKLFLFSEDNRNHAKLPVGEGRPEEGLLCTLWGDYRVWTAARWTKDEKLEMQIRMVNGEYYQVFAIDLKDDGTSADVSLYSGPWDRRNGKPDQTTYPCTMQKEMQRGKRN